MITHEFIETANRAAAVTGFINPDFRAATKGENAYTFRSYYDFNGGTNSKGETLKIEVSTGEDSGDKKQLAAPLAQDRTHAHDITPLLVHIYLCYRRGGQLLGKIQPTAQTPKDVHG